MARTRLPIQQDLLSDTLRISSVRADVELLLEHVVRLQSETIALAAAYGVTQPELATLAQVSRQRIGQLCDEVDVATLSPSALRDQIDQVSELPQDVMSALAQLRHPRDEDDSERREVLRKQIAVVYGQVEADRRHEGRSKFLASLATDPERRALVARSTETARRRVYGASAENAPHTQSTSRPIALGEPSPARASCASGACGRCDACLDTYDSSDARSEAQS